MIKGRRIALRHMTEQDLPLVYRMAADSDWRGQHLPSMLRSPHAVRKTFLESGYASEELEMFLVVDENAKVIGQALHFETRSDTTREVGYLIVPEARGHGFAAEALGLLVNHLFANKPLNRLEAQVAVGNVASQRAVSRTGFTREGVLRGSSFVNGGYIDLEMHSLLRHEWQAVRAHR